MAGFGAGEWALLASTLGGQALSKVGNDSTELSSYADVREGPNFSNASKPGPMLETGRRKLEDYLSLLQGEIDRPSEIQTTVNPLPSFAGGGLPFAISSPGLDRRRLPLPRGVSRLPSTGSSNPDAAPQQGGGGSMKRYPELPPGVQTSIGGLDMNTQSPPYVDTQGQDPNEQVMAALRLLGIS